MGSTLDEALRVLIREVLREELQAVLEKLEQRAEAPPPASPDDLLTVREAARYAKVDMATVHAWIRKGVLGTYRAGRVYRVKRNELDAYLARQGQPAPTVNLRQRARDFLSRGSSPSLRVRSADPNEILSE